MKTLLLAIQFLTIIPVRVKGEVSEDDLVDAAVFFPVAGALQGLLLVLTAAVAINLFPPEVVSGFVILAHLIANGAFDLDGLIDTFDALAIKSTGDPREDLERRLSAMKDSNIGAMGAIALVMNILLKFILLNALFHALSPKVVFALLFLMPVFSKWLTVPAMYHGVSARRDGLGRIFIDNMTRGNVILSTVLTFVLCLIAEKAQLYKAYGMKSLWLMLVLFLSFYALSLAAARFSYRKFGGFTGDCFGALSEVSEMLFLVVVLRWL